MDDFYCGANVRLYLGGRWVTDIVTIEWAESNSKAPLYGYASTEYDTVMEGQFLVQGKFTIAFRQFGYLDTLLRSNFAPDTSALTSDNVDSDAFNAATAEALVKLPLTDFQRRTEALQARYWNAYQDPSTRSVRMPRVDKLPGGYSISLMYGTLPDEESAGFDHSLNFTMRTLVDVHFTGSGQLVAPTGDPIAEYYTFFAKDVDKIVSPT